LGYGTCIWVAFTLKAEQIFSFIDVACAHKLADLWATTISELTIWDLETE
jgi:hypothetical protein